MKLDRKSVTLQPKTEESKRKQDEVVIGASETEDADETSRDTASHRFSANGFNVPDLIALTARLAQVLAQETDLLDEMKVSQIEGLQKDKIALVNALEQQKRIIERHPELLDEINADDWDDLQQVVAIFSEVQEENYRKLMIARAVNQKMVEAIRDVVTEQQKQFVYDENGLAEKTNQGGLSVTVDQKA